MKKIFTFWAAVLCGLTLNAKTLYLNPGSGDNNWAKDGAVLFVHSWDAQDDDAQFTGSGDVLSAEIPDGNNHVKIVRMPAGSASLNWDTKWNATGDLAIPEGKNLYTITGWGTNDGEWSVYGNGGGNENPGGQGGETPGDQGDNELEESGQYHDFALIGSIGGDWNIQEQKAEYTFDERGRWTGTLGANPTSPAHAAFVVIMDEEGNQYKTKGWLGETTKATLYWANGFENSNVWQLPADVTLYLIMRKCTFKGSIEVESVDQATYDAYTIDWGTENPGGGEEQHQAIDQVEDQKQARKMIIDGQLRIVRGEKVFDATGRQL